MLKGNITIRTKPETISVLVKKGASDSIMRQVQRSDIAGNNWSSARLLIVRRTVAIV